MCMHSRLHDAQPKTTCEKRGFYLHPKQPLCDCAAPVEMQVSLAGSVSVTLAQAWASGIKLPPEASKVSQSRVWL